MRVAPSTWPQALPPLALALVAFLAPPRLARAQSALGRPECALDALNRALLDGRQGLQGRLGMPQPLQEILAGGTARKMPLAYLLLPFVQHSVQHPGQSLQFGMSPRHLSTLLPPDGHVLF